MRSIGLSLLLALGCEPHDITVLSDACWTIEALNDEQVMATLSAMAEWNAALDATRLRACDGHGTIRFVPGAAAGDSVGGVAVDWTTIVIYPDVIDAWDGNLEVVIAHELGHVLGIWDHLPSGIMCPGDVESLCIDALAVEQVCLWFPCGPAAGSTCAGGE